MSTTQAVREKPLLFSAPMVLALLAGRKTQTRRLSQRGQPLRPGDRIWVKETYALVANESLEHQCIVYRADQAARLVMADEGGEGDTLWLGEPCKPYAEPACWRSSMFMPRWASRIMLEVVADERQEPLQSISAEACAAEGFARITKDQGRTWKWGIPDRDGLPGGCDVGWVWQDWEVDIVKAQARLWDSINGDKPGARWADNPTVSVIEFKVLP